ncbi:uncharacterized protein PRCAT00004854001 [Priceomyces carsonii]|uniref:uncharacterized protein n=1 Tax=Priceomyces carsonii TaxID=28549 RepID=UPI002ED78676|nr:unnamed protein product [Priceomyces carsonii]
MKDSKRSTYLLRFGDELYPKTPPLTQPEHKSKAVRKLERIMEIVTMLLDCPGSEGIYPKN